MGRRWRECASRLLLIVGSLTLTVGVVEAILRLALREEEANRNYWGKGAFEEFPTAGYRHAPGFEGFAYRRGVFEAPVTISRLGLRQADLEQQLAYPERILLLGDSFAFGLGVAESETFSRRLAERFNPFEVGIVNGGQTGYSAAQEATLGRWLAPQVHPTAIVQFLYLANDVPDDFRRHYENIDVVYGYRLRSNRWPRLAIVDFVRTHSYVWMNLAGRLDSLRARREARALSRRARLDPVSFSQNTIRAVLELRRFAADNDIRFAVVLIPRWKAVGAGGSGKRTPFTEPVVDALVGESVATFDLGDCSFEETDILAPDEHWSEAGHRRVAGCLAPFLDELLSRSLSRDAAGELATSAPTTAFVR